MKCDIGSHVFGELSKIKQLVLSDKCVFKSDSLYITYVKEVTYYVYDDVKDPVTFNWVIQAFYIAFPAQVEIKKDSFSSLNIIGTIGFATLVGEIKVPRIFGSLDTITYITIRGNICFTECPYVSANNLENLDLIIPDPNDCDITSLNHINCNKFNF